LGTPVEPVTLGENPKGDTKQNIDGEDFSLHVTSGKVPKSTRPMT
jgi:hypothetical protein